MTKERIAVHFACPKCGHHLVSGALALWGEKVVTVEEWEDDAGAQP